MVVEISRAELNVGVPAIAHKLVADYLPPFVAVTQGFVEHQSVAIYGPDAPHLEGLALVHAHANQGPRLKSAGVAQLNPAVAGGGVSHKFLSLHREGTHRGLIVEPGVHPVAALNVELDEVDVDIGFAEEVVLPGILQLALEKDVHAVFTGVGPYGQGILQAVVGPDRVLLLLQHVKLAHGVNNTSGPAQRDGQVDGVNNKFLDLGAFGAQAPRSVLSRLGRAGPGPEGLQEGSGTVVGSEGGSAGQVRPQEGVSQLSRRRIEIQGGPGTRLRGDIALPGFLGFHLVQVQVSFFSPVQHRGVVLFGHAGWRELALHPLRQVLLGDLQRLAFPVNSCVYQLHRRYGGLNASCTAR